MKYLSLVLLSFLFLQFSGANPDLGSSIPTARSLSPDSIPAMLKGHFTDDYGIGYTITDSVWTQHPQAKYHILKWNTKEQFLIARNDAVNPSDGELYTRIDYMPFTGMPPYEWGFCLTVYNAKSDSLATAAKQADRDHPRKGCNGFPFSRMKRTK